MSSSRLKIWVPTAVRLASLLTVAVLSSCASPDRVVQTIPGPDGRPITIITPQPDVMKEGFISDAQMQTLKGIIGGNFGTQEKFIRIRRELPQSTQVFEVLEYRMKTAWADGAISNAEYFEVINGIIPSLFKGSDKVTKPVSVYYWDTKDLAAMQESTANNSNIKILDFSYQGEFEPAPYAPITGEELDSAKVKDIITSCDTALRTLRLRARDTIKLNLSDFRLSNLTDIEMDWCQYVTDLTSLCAWRKLTRLWAPYAAVPDYALVKLLDECPLVSVNIQAVNTQIKPYNTVVTDKVIDAIVRSRTLTTLCASDNNVPDNFLKRMAGTQIQELDISGCSIDMSSLANTLKDSKNFISLRKLTISLDASSLPLESIRQARPSLDVRSR